MKFLKNIAVVAGEVEVQQPSKTMLGDDDRNVDIEGDEDSPVTMAESKKDRVKKGDPDETPNSTGGKFFYMFE